METMIISKMKEYLMLIVVTLAIAYPSVVFSECLEYTIIDHGDRVEAVCIGAPLMPAEREKLNQEIQQRDQLIEQQQQKNKAAQASEEISRQLAKVNCTGVPGECGPGRVCMVFYGLCKTKEDANRITDRVTTGIQNSQRDFQNKQGHNEINQKLDDIDRKLRNGY